jgi:hypothetical protein
MPHPRDANDVIHFNYLSPRLGDFYRSGMKSSVKAANAEMISASSDEECALIRKLTPARCVNNSRNSRFCTNKLELSVCSSFLCVFQLHSVCQFRKIIVIIFV